MQPKILSIALLLFVGAVQAEEPKKLLSTDDVDCSRVKGYQAREQCYAEQKKPDPATEIKDATGKPLADRMAWQNKDQAPVNSILKGDLACERFSRRPADKATITVKDASQEFEGRAVYVYLKVINEGNETELPDDYMNERLVNTFAVKMTDGKIHRLGEGQWIEKDTRVRGGNPYRIKMHAINPGNAIVTDIVCLTQS